MLRQKKKNQVILPMKYMHKNHSSLFNIFIDVDLHVLVKKKLSCNKI